VCKTSILKHKRYFTERIKVWFFENGRSFIWRERTDPFTVTVSEVFLKKTRAENAEQQLLLFFKDFHSFEEIAASNKRKLSSYFKKLGLLDRGQGLLKLARQISIDFEGNIPDAISNLKRIYFIGDYSANAILCFSFGKRVPIVDVNVIRIFKRFFGIEVPGKSPHKDRKIWEFAKKMLPVKNIKEYNWGLLDFGAIVCSERNPKCQACPLKRRCLYFRNSS